VDPRSSGGGDALFARPVVADFSLVGRIQIVPKLIVNMNIVISDAKTERMISFRSIAMCGRTDESWSRAIDWLIRYDLLAPPGQGVFQ
ncbi:MAG TPA: DUF2380 domain-containing protein, partial [Candidatus Binatia bacterium]